MTKLYPLDLDVRELACRMVEKAGGVTRPPGLTAQQALEAMEPEFRRVYGGAAAVACEYLLEQLGKSGLTLRGNV